MGLMLMKIKRKDKGLYRIIQIMFLCGTLVMANVLFTMVKKQHLWSGKNVMDPRIASSIVNTTIHAKRGTIYDRNYNVIAQETAAYTIVAYLDPSFEDIEGNPDYVSDTTKTAKKLAKVLKDTSSKQLKDILDKQIDNGLLQTELGKGTKRIDKETMEKVKALKLPGIHFLDDYSRNYPVSPFSSNLIGFAAYDEDKQEISGKIGLESSMNDILSGQDGSERYQQAVDGTVLPGTRTVFQKAEDGKNVVLTIDGNLQETVENVMKATMEDNDAKKAWCVVMEVETGNILAWASYPTFDQNDTKEIPSYTDNVSEMSMEPGSVMKAFTYATAVDTGVFPSDTYYRAGQFNYTYDTTVGKIVRTNEPVEGYPPVQDALGTDYGTLTFEDGLAHSSNVAICELLANYINPDDFDTYLHNFGFFEATDIPYVNETTGWAHLESVTDYLSSGFGQSSSVTSLQLLQAYSAIFNDGQMVLPHVVSSIEDPNTGEAIEKYTTESKGNPISKETANKMKAMLKRVLEPGMSGSRFAIDGVEMMAKTGTGEYYDEETGSYSDTIYTSSIMAAAPYEDPKIMVYWGMIGTNYVNYSGSYFQQVMQASLIAQGISGGETAGAEDLSENWVTYTMPSLVNHSNTYVQERLTGMNLSTVYIGDGSNVIEQYPIKNTQITTNDHIFLLTDGKNITMPNMTGWTYKDVSVYCDMAGIQFAASGNGKVVEQSIEEGTKIDKNTQISINFD